MIQRALWPMLANSRWAALTMAQMVNKKNGTLKAKITRVVRT